MKPDLSFDEMISLSSAPHSLENGDNLPQNDNSGKLFVVVLVSVITGILIGMRNKAGIEEGFRAPDSPG